MNHQETLTWLTLQKLYQENINKVYEFGKKKKKKKTHEQFSLTIVDELFEADHPNEASVKTKTFSNKVSTQQIQAEKSVLTYI